ncbi:SemiSWEET transporter [Candidatus Roizmanbacteria bacterium]|nr:SemiSWEET transporter [Candidatus Roizmanbacteria bacterium]
MDNVNLLGYVATVVSSISALPQLIKTWRTKSTKDISLQMILLICISVSLWLLYGFMLRALPIILANFIVLVIWLIILSFKLKYK